MIKQLKITFGGSFQARLATDSDGTDASPTDPDGTYGAKSSGWTFAYREGKFDRIIRLSSPVQLRTALVDSWEDAAVTSVEADDGKGLAAVPGDPLLKQTISLGKAKFDTKKGGGGVTREAIVDLKFSIGSMLEAEPASLPVLDGAKGSQTSWSTDYGAKKKPLIKSSTIDAVRAKVLGNLFDSYQSFFSIRCPSKPFALKGVLFSKTVSGVLTQLDSPASTKYDWTMEMAFFRFDGDTLSGKMDGTLVAKRRTAP